MDEQPTFLCPFSGDLCAFFSTRPGEFVGMRFSVPQILVLPVEHPLIMELVLNALRMQNGVEPATGHAIIFGNLCDE